MKKLIVIAGPTASGKTALSVALAKQLNTVIFSADSRQFYKETSIGTAKPTVEEMNGVKHYFIDSHSITDEISSAEFVKQATPLLYEEFEKHDTVILTGGSGMFIDALCYGLDDLPHSNELRQELNEEYESNGLEELLAEIENKDPEHFKVIDKKNPMRVIRAVELLRLTGKKISDIRTQKKVNHPFEIHYFVLTHDRNALYDRINKRVDMMFEAGLLAEVKSLIPFQKLQSLNTVGYKELFSFFNGDIDLTTATELIKQNSRRYAKRQMTWFRRNEAGIELKFDTVPNMIKKICTHINQ